MVRVYALILIFFPVLFPYTMAHLIHPSIYPSIVLCDSFLFFLFLGHNDKCVFYSSKTFFSSTGWLKCVLYIFSFPFATFLQIIGFCYFVFAFHFLFLLPFWWIEFFIIHIIKKDTFRQLLPIFIKVIEILCVCVCDCTKTKGHYAEIKFVIIFCSENCDSCNLCGWNWLLVLFLSM